MKRDHRDDMNERREPLTAFERKFRPKNGTHWIGPLVVWLGVLIGCYLIAIRWMEWSGFKAGPAQLDSPVERPAPAKTVSLITEGNETHAMSTPRIQRIVKCTSRTSQASYSNGACPPDTHSSTVAIQPDLNLADGLRPEERIASLQDNRLRGAKQQQYEASCHSASCTRQTRRSCNSHSF